MTATGDAQVIFVGSGINSMVGAALLALRGKRVLVLERNDRLGGCIRTEELFPGYLHEVFSSWHPLFVGSPAYAELKPALDAAGLEILSCGYTTGLVLPDGRGLACPKDLEATARQLEVLAPGDGEALRQMAGRLFGEDAPLLFGLLGNNPYSREMLGVLYRAWRAKGLDGLMDFAVQGLESFRRWSSTHFRSDLSRALMAPWTLHTGLGPDDAGSALIGKLTFAAVVSGGMPVIKGGGSQLVAALQQIIESRGGSCQTGAEVSSILLAQQGRKRVASGVRLASGQAHLATEAVVCNVTPQQLYEHLLPDAPPAVRAKAQAYRYGRGCMQVHFALSEPPAWREPELLKVPLVHLTESLEQVCLSVTEARNGLLPARPTLGIGQPVAVDPSRAPVGGWILWIQMQELPTRLAGDAAGEIEVPADGGWNEAVREAFADRVQQRLEGVMPGLAERLVGRRAYSPADLEALNGNLVGGDPYSGICSPDQFFWFRPFAATGGARAHQTPVSNVFHIGASTHPGPGLGAGSGTMVANRLSKK